MERASIRHLRHFGDRSRNGRQFFIFLIKPGNGLEQPLCVRVERFFKQTVYVSMFDDFAAVHDDNIVRHFGDNAERVGNHDEGGAVCLLNVLDKVQDLGLNGHVQSGRRLVANQKLWTAA